MNCAESSKLQSIKLLKKEQKKRHKFNFYNNLTNNKKLWKSLQKPKKLKNAKVRQNLLLKNKLQF